MTRYGFVIQRVLGLLIMAFSASMVPPLLVSLLYQDGEHLHFLYSFALTFALGVGTWYPVRRQVLDLRTRDGFIIVALFWGGFSVLSSVPLMMSPPHLSFTDAVFEAVSGLTTSGGTVITGLDALPRSILYFRMQLHWLGGMGIIVLAVAIMPLLGVGGMQLYRAETAGPMKDERLTPRIRHTARALWRIYLGLTVVCAVAYWLAGMDAFDAIGHSFSTVATGGFSTHDASLGYFDSPLIELIAIVFMLLGAINFGIHFLAWRRLGVEPYRDDVETKAFLRLTLVLIIVVVATLVWQGYADSPLESLRHGMFHVVSVITTTGFTTTDFSAWPLFLPVLLVFSSFVGGCAGSTSGGMKVVRIIVLFRNGVREVRQLIHPRANMPIRIGRQVLSDRVSAAIWGFFAAYVVLFVLMLLVLMAAGLDQITAFSAVASCLNNLGPGLGDVAFHFGDLPDVAKWTLTAAMLLGRLEIFTILVLFSRSFWRS